MKSGGRYPRAELTVKAGGQQTKYSVELGGAVKIQFNSSSREAAEEATRLLRLAGVEAEARSRWDNSVNRERRYVKASIDKLATARRELREALAQAVQGRGGGAPQPRKSPAAEATQDKLLGAAGLRRRLEGGVQSTSPLAVEHAARRLEDLGLKPGIHYRAKKPEGGKGWVAITPEGLRRLAHPAARAQDEHICREALLQQIKEAAEGGVRRRLEEEVEAAARRSSPA